MIFILKNFYFSFKTAWQFFYASWQLRKVPPCVTVCGSARFSADHHFYQLGYELGKTLGKGKIPVLTGGGPGIMEAVNKGVREAGGASYGCNILLPREQKPNPYLDSHVTTRYFFVRKVILVRSSRGFIFLPGGLGTLDEMFEFATLMQTGKTLSQPIVLMGSEYWKPLLDYVNSTLVKEGAVSPREASRFVLTDSPQEAMKYATGL